MDAAVSSTPPLVLAAPVEVLTASSSLASSNWFCGVVYKRRHCVIVFNVTRWEENKHKGCAGGRTVCGEEAVGKKLAAAQRLRYLCDTRRVVALMARRSETQTESTLTRESTSRWTRPSAIAPAVTCTDERVNSESFFFHSFDTSRTFRKLQP